MARGSIKASSGRPSEYFTPERLSNVFLETGLANVLLEAETLLKPLGPETMKIQGFCRDY